MVNETDIIDIEPDETIEKIIKKKYLEEITENIDIKEVSEIKIQRIDLENGKLWFEATGLGSKRKNLEEVYEDRYSHEISSKVIKNKFMIRKEAKKYDYDARFGGLGVKLTHDFNKTIQFKYSPGTIDSPNYVIQILEEKFTYGEGDRKHCEEEFEFDEFKTAFDTLKEILHKQDQIRYRIPEDINI